MVIRCGYGAGCGGGCAADTGHAQSDYGSGVELGELLLGALGRHHAVIMYGNQLWDTLGGVLLAREAGAVVVDADGTPHTTRSQWTIAATRSLLPAVLPIVQAAADEDRHG